MQCKSSYVLSMLNMGHQTRKLHFYLPMPLVMTAEQWTIPDRFDGYEIMIHHLIDSSVHATPILIAS